MTKEHEFNFSQPVPMTKEQHEIFFAQPGGRVLFYVARNNLPHFRGAGVDKTEMSKPTASAR